MSNQIAKETALEELRSALSGPPFRIYAFTGFQGWLPVGTSAVVVAPNKERAIQLLMERLERIGLPGIYDEQTKNIEIIEIAKNQEQAIVLNDGDY